MNRKKILSSLIFFIIGLTLFWLVYRNFNLTGLKSALKELRYEWVAVSVVFCLLSHFFRALRWKMLIEAMGYKAGVINLFLSILVLYFTNLIIPRGGEISRCGVISKYEKVPFVKLIGTVLVERLTDFLTFFLVFLILLMIRFSFFEKLLNISEFRIDFSSIHSKILILLMSLFSFLIIIYLLLKFNVLRKISAKIKKLKTEFFEGMLTIINIKSNMLFIFYTLIIFAIWLLMFYSVFLAYPPTRNLSFLEAALTFALGTLAFLLPIQAGIGPWHFIVVTCLLIFGIDKESGLIFALLSHTITNLIFLILGPVALALLPVLNNKKQK